MDFGDESYVRLYTRKTLTNRQLGWEGRAVLQAMLGGEEFDRAGVFQYRGDPVTCIATVTELPVEVVRVGLERLVELTETWVITDDAVVWPTYHEAQTCARSDKVRQLQSRVRRASVAANGSKRGTNRRLPRVTTEPEPPEPVTPSHTPSQPDTPSHATSPNVTPNLAELSSAEPRECLSRPPGAAVDAPTPSPPPTVVREVFAEWQRVHGHPDAKLDAKRSARIRGALKLHSPEKLKQAIRGALKDDWLMGRDPKSPRKFDGLETILRDTAKIEALADLETGKTKPPRRLTNGSIQPDAGRTGAEHFRGIRV